MDMSGEFRIPASREAVWKALNDPAILRQCIAGCEELNKLSDTEFVAKVVARVGPVKATFSGKVTLSDLDPPNGYKITGEGQGGAAGFAKGGADVHLQPEGSGTLLKYTVSAAIGGKLAQIGARLIDGTARKMAEDFFAKFAALVAGQQPVAGVPTPATTPSTSSDEAAPESSLDEDPPPAPAPHAAPAEMKPDIDVGGHSSGSIKPWIWVGALILVAIALLVIYG